MFKHMSYTSLQVLLSLYNSIWNSGVTHQSWSHSLVPIRKPDKPSLFTLILPTHLTYKQRLQACGKDDSPSMVLGIKRSGFRERRTTDHILRLHDAVQKALANKHHLLAIFIDLEKAYNMYNKNVLLFKILKLHTALNSPHPIHAAHS